MFVTKTFVFLGSARVGCFLVVGFGEANHCRCLASSNIRLPTIAICHRKRASWWRKCSISSCIKVSMHTVSLAGTTIFNFTDGRPPFWVSHHWLTCFTLLVIRGWRVVVGVSGPSSLFMRPRKVRRHPGWLRRHFSKKTIPGML
jgi:hypothetical protein